MLRRQVKPLHVVVVVVLVMAIAAAIGWKLTFGKKPEPMKHWPKKRMGGQGIEGVVPGQSESEAPATPPRGP